MKKFYYFIIFNEACVNIRISNGKKMKLTVEYLKQESANFDLECVFILDLNNKGFYYKYYIVFLFKYRVVKYYDLIFRYTWFGSDKRMC